MAKPTEATIIYRSGLRYRAYRVLDGLRAWGRHQFSLVIMPHNAVNPWKISVTNNLLVFFSVISLLLGGLFIRFFVLPQNEIATIRRLDRQVQTNSLYQAALQLQMRHLRNQLEEIAAFTHHLSRVVWPDFPLPLDRMLHDSEPDQAAEKNLGTYISVVRDLQQTRLQLRNLQQYFRNVGNLLHKRMDIYRKMPQGNPLGYGVGYWTSGFGWRANPFFIAGDANMHAGQDIASLPGTPIYAAADGYVVDASSGGGLGLFVRLRHDFGFSTIYAHMSEIETKEKVNVRKGQLIGRVGQTGLASGPHLHYEVHIGDIPINPLWYMNPLQDSDD